MQGRPGEAPGGTFHQVVYGQGADDRADGRELVVRYAYQKESDGRFSVEVDLLNHSARPAHYTLYFETQRRALSVGDAHGVSAVVSAQGVASPIMLAIGFQFYQADATYLSDLTPASGEYKPWLGSEQRLSARFVGGAVDPVSGAVPAGFLPRLSVYNIPPKGSVRLRLQDVRLTVQAVSTKDEVLPLRRPLPVAAPGQLVPLTVELSVAPQKGSFKSNVSLRKLNGERTLEYQRNLELRYRGAVKDVWFLRLPPDLVPGQYKVTYALPGLRVSKDLGSLTVTSSAGMFIGMAFHRYPGASETELGPLQLKYQFARSLASDETYLMQWWTGPDQYDWKGVSKWANFHAKPGERKLVFTFSGSPRWASSQPNQPAAMGTPGNAAPPAPEYRKAYQRMVRETMLRFKGRVLASECWNEPNNTAFFSGTQTELADLCKAVYIATKSVDPTVRVICPQADGPSHLDFVYGAKTSAGEPIHQYCDLVGSHVYDRLGQDKNGNDYAAQRLHDYLDEVVAMGQKYGINKPLAVTEYGVSSCMVRPTVSHPTVFGRMDAQEASEAIYGTIAGFREFGVSLLGLYSYDHQSNDPRCRPGGSFIRMTYLDPFGDLKIDPVMVKKVNEAVADFGWAGHE